MQQIKIFEEHDNNENDINLWLKTNPQVEVTSVNMIPMHDLYASGVVCNQWVATIVTYKMNWGKVFSE